MSEPLTEKVHILDKEYTVACPPDERHALLESARMLDERMREIRDSGSVVGSERLAVMAALNMAYDLLREQNGGLEGSATKRLRSLSDRIDSVLREDGEQLKL